MRCCLCLNQDASYLRTGVTGNLNIKSVQASLTMVIANLLRQLCLQNIKGHRQYVKCLNGIKQNQTKNCLLPRNQTPPGYLRYWWNEEALWSIPLNAAYKPWAELKNGVLMHKKVFWIGFMLWWGLVWCLAELPLTGFPAELSRHFAILAIRILIT